ncbi:DUF1997 domain-containing protein [Phormidium tenue FACHB-886]|nr:DUF1997 domain-containing protein [Phormidium tenue FACHB-886]
MEIRLFASQSVALSVPEQPIPIQHYLRQPQRLINALVDPTRVEQLSEDTFRLKMRPLSFLVLSLQPTVDLRILANADGSIAVESIACEILGVEYINQRFNLKLVGKLTPTVINGVTWLKGKADLEVQVDVPPPLLFTPKPILEATGNGLLRSVLLTIKQRLMYQLLQDYRQWALIQVREEANANAPLLSPNRSVT